MFNQPPTLRGEFFLTLSLAFATIRSFAQIDLPGSRGIANGIFQQTWESLSAPHKCPDWFRNAKFGIWAAYGPQFQDEDGRISIKTLANDTALWQGSIRSNRMPGVPGKLKFTRDKLGLHLEMPKKMPCDCAFVVKITR